MYLIARDYHFHKDGRQYVSQPFHIRIVTAAEHAKIVQEEFTRKLAELDNVVRDQEGLIDRGRTLKNSEDLNSTLPATFDSIPTYSVARFSGFTSETEFFSSPK